MWMNKMNEYEWILDLDLNNKNLMIDLDILNINKILFILTHNKIYILWIVIHKMNEYEFIKWTKKWTKIHKNLDFARSVKGKI